MQQHLLSQPPVASAPAFDVPAGACDCHAHVFGPYERFPLAQERTYTPPECSADTYLAMLDTIGFARGVLVQGSAHGTDNRAMLHALSRAPDRLRGVAVLDRAASYDDLVNMHRQGVRGLRFNRAHGANRFKSVVDVSELSHLAPSMRRAGLHAQLWIDAHELHELEPLIRAAKLPIVIDHFGKFVTERGLDDRSFVLLCRLLEEGLVWIKMTAYRLSKQYPDYADVRPFHERLVSINPSQLVWGSDWPHVNMKENIPDAGHLATLLAQWTPVQQHLEQILVVNPAQLYGF
jgi:predicted TIM-barrel fold metal-dependent hydrolase